MELDRFPVRVLVGMNENDYQDLSSYDYDLPEDRIAQEPLAIRSSSKLLVSLSGDLRIRRVSDLPDLLQSGDLVVVNDSKVFSARLRLRRASGGYAEVLLLEEVEEGIYSALLRPSRKLSTGEALFRGGSEVLRLVRSTKDCVEGELPLVKLSSESVVDLFGEVPLPPYIKKKVDDPQRYQTIYAHNYGSVAAPTAGLHLDEEVFSGFRRRSIEVATVELMVGIDTFKPISSSHIGEHKMHSERYSVSPETWERIRSAKRVVAIGTTVVRTLESVAATSRLEGRTDLYITPGYDFKVVDVLMTNFHTPKSSLLVLIASFYGPKWRELYQYALDSDFRFLSFGDAMLIERNNSIEW